MTKSRNTASALDAFIAKKAEIASIKDLLKPGRAEIRVVLRLDEKGRDVEVAVPGRYEINPMVKGSLFALPGVLEVVDL